MSDTAEIERITKDAEVAAKAKAIRDGTKALEEIIKANAPECANRDHAISLLGDAAHCALWAITSYKVK